MEYRREEVSAREVFRAPYVWQESDGVLEALRAAGDDRVFRIDTASLRAGFDRRAQPSRYADDGIHPNGDGAARLGALAAAAVRALLERGDKTHVQ